MTFVAINTNQRTNHETTNTTKHQGRIMLGTIWKIIKSVLVTCLYTIILTLGWIFWASKETQHSIVLKLIDYILELWKVEA
jgi:hypothetical protein